MTREDFAEIVRNYLYLPADAVISTDHLDAVEKEAWRIVDEGKYIDPIAVEILEMVERYRKTICVLCQLLCQVRVNYLGGFVAVATGCVENP